MMNNILDIHTHEHEAESGGKSIINYRLAAEASFIEGYYYSVGIHPWDLTIDSLKQLVDFLCRQLPNQRIVAIGEAGLDKLTKAPMPLQLIAFGLQVEIAEEYKLPLVIHCVKAMGELLAVKKKYHPRQPWIWHGFRGKPEQAKQLLDKGFYLSFGEFYSEKAMKIVPDDRLFLETDESSLDIEDILHRAAKVRGVEVAELREIVRRNIQRVFFNA